MEKQLNTIQGNKLACAKMAPRKVEERARSGHVTGQRSLRGGVAVKDYRGRRQTQCFSRIII